MPYSIHAIQICRFVPFSLIAVLTVAIVIVSITQKPIYVQSQHPTEKEVVTHNVILGEKITIHINTHIDDHIKEVRLLFRPHGKDTIESYSYVEFTQAGNLHATGEIDVQSPSYFPPGTVFDIRFEFTSINDIVYESSTYRVEHLGSAHDWRRVGDDRLEIVYYGVNNNAIQKLHALASEKLPEISSALGVTDFPRFRAVVFPNLRELTIHGPRISQAATDGQYFGGFAYDEYNLTIMSSPSTSVLIHELTHLIFGRALTSHFATAAPAWLNEGNASYWETGSREESLRQFSSIARSGEVTEFAAMNTVPGLRRDIHNFYIQSTDFVGYLIENYGRDSIGKLLAELNTGKNIDDSMRAIYGGSLTQIETDWRREWGLPTSTSSPSAPPLDVHTDLQPTIPGLPTITKGSLEVELQISQSTPLEPTPATVEQKPTTIPQPDWAVLPPRVTVAPTPIPTRDNIYFVPSSGDNWPQVKPSAVIVFVFLALGVAAMMYRRIRT